MLLDEADDIIGDGCDGLVFGVVRFLRFAAEIKAVSIEILASFASCQVRGDMVVRDMPFAT